MANVLYCLTISLASFIVGGRVTDYETDKPLQGASIEISGTTQGTSTDTNGHFTLQGLQTHKTKLIVSYIGYTSETIYIDSRKENSSALNIRLKPQALPVPGIDIQGEPPLQDRICPEAAFDITDLRQMPANFGDDALRSLPGVTGGGMSKNVWAGPPVIRGGDTDENLIFYDGVEIPWAWHLAGFNSIFNTDFIDSVSLNASSIPFTYDALSAVTLVKPHRVNDAGGRFAYDVIGLKGAAWTPIGSNFDIAASLRKTTYYIFFGPLGNRSLTSFWDAACNLGYDFFTPTSNRLQLTMLVSNDTYSSNYAERTWLYKLGFTHYGRLKISADASFTQHSLLYGNSFFSSNYYYSHSSLLSSTNILWQPFDRLEFSINQQLGFEMTSRCTDSLNSATSFQIAAEPLRNLVFLSDVRFSRTAWTKGYKLAPRFSLQYSPFKILTLSADYRDSYQHPYRVLRSSFYPGEQVLKIVSPLDFLYPEENVLEPKRAQHYSVGAELSFKNILSLKTDLYYRTLKDLPLLKEDTAWTSEGYGYSKGIETTLNLEGIAGFWGNLTYSLSETKRKEQNYDQLTWGEYDQKHSLFLRFGYRFPKHVYLTSALHLASGRPYTPIVYDSTDRPIWGKPNSARAESYTRLDIRLEKRLPDRELSPYFYIEIINLLNTQGFYWMKEYIDSTGNIVECYYSQIPLLPVAGIGGSF